MFSSHSSCLTTKLNGPAVKLSTGACAMSGRSFREGVPTDSRSIFPQKSNASLGPLPCPARGAERGSASVGIPLPTLFGHSPTSLDHLVDTRQKRFGDR